MLAAPADFRRAPLATRALLSLFSADPPGSGRRVPRRGPPRLRVDARRRGAAGSGPAARGRAVGDAGWTRCWPGAAGRSSRPNRPRAPSGDRADGDPARPAALSPTRRRTLERKQRRLAEIGCLHFDVLPAGGDVRAWIDAFLQLEADGWKGRGRHGHRLHRCGSPLFQRRRRVGVRARRLLAHGLYLDGRPIALRRSFLAGAGSFAFKTTYDEAYRRFSPGVLLELDNLRRLGGSPAVRWMDSCTAADNFVINGLWDDRLRPAFTDRLHGPLGGRSARRPAARPDSTQTNPVPPPAGARRGEVCQCRGGMMTPQTLTPRIADQAPPGRGEVTSPLLVIDPETFQTHFNQKPYLLPHHLGDHPLFALPRLIELRGACPRSSSNTTRATSLSVSTRALRRATACRSRKPSAASRTSAPGWS